MLKSWIHAVPENYYLFSIYSVFSSDSTNLIVLCQSAAWVILQTVYTWCFSEESKHTSIIYKVLFLRRCYVYRKKVVIFRNCMTSRLQHYIDSCSSWAGNIWNKRKKIKYYTVQTIPEFNRRIVDTLAKSRFFLLNKSQCNTEVLKSCRSWKLLLFFYL
jgi:hypothetical protein